MQGPHYDQRNEHQTSPPALLPLSQTSLSDSATTVVSPHYHGEIIPGGTFAMATQTDSTVPKECLGLARPIGPAFFRRCSFFENPGAATLPQQSDALENCRPASLSEPGAPTRRSSSAGLRRRKVNPSLGLPHARGARKYSCSSISEALFLVTYFKTWCLERITGSLHLSDCWRNPPCDR